MDRFDGTGIESMLRELRPAPRPEFVAELDARAAGGFARGNSRVKRAIGRLRATPRRRILAPAATCAVVAITAATAVVLIVGDESTPPTRAEFSAVVQPPSRHEKGPRNSFGALPTRALPAHAAEANGLQVFPAALSHRDIERSARITLLADPGDVADDSAQVFAAVHDAHGIVLRSNTTQGSASRAGASFELLVPSARLEDALAAISAIDEVGSRHDATADITRSTVAARERVRQIQEVIKTLRAKLAASETEAERELLEADIRHLRSLAAAQRAKLAHLHRRTHFSHLSVRIETGDSPGSSGAWGFDDALGNAGHILGVAAGVTLVGLAVLAPLAILALLAWLAHRAWLRLRRERALS